VLEKHTHEDTYSCKSEKGEAGLPAACGALWERSREEYIIHNQQSFEKGYWMANVLYKYQQAKVLPLDRKRSTFFFAPGYILTNFVSVAHDFALEAGQTPRNQGTLQLEMDSAPSTQGPPCGHHC